MRPLLLALPCLALATACTEPCTAPALTVAWRFDLAGGGRDASCQAAGVATVSLWLDGAAAGLDMDCGQGAATFTGLAAGAHDFTIQGHSASGQLIYQDWGLVDVGGCGETRATLRPGAGYLRIAYTTSTGSCAGPDSVPGYIWYLLQDASTGAAVSWVNGSRSPDALACQTEAGQPEVNVLLPYGLYSLRWIQDVRDPLADPLADPPAPRPSPIYQYCTPTPATLHAQGFTTLAVQLAPVSGPCSP